MDDLSVFGKAGLIIQYEDVVSLLGYNIAEYFKANHVNEKFERMSFEDILLSYMNREQYDINAWISETFDYNINYHNLMDSKLMLKPNMLYAYKVFQESSKQRMNTLYIYSEQYSKAIESNLPTFQVPTLLYEHGNLVNLLNEHPNCTFITSNPDSIALCKEVKCPFILTIVDEFVYLKDILSTRITDELLKQGKMVFYTGIISGGITNVIRDDKI